MKTIKLFFYSTFACVSLTSFVGADSLFGSLGDIAKKIEGKEKSAVKGELGSLSSLEKRIVDVHAFWDPSFDKDIDHTKVDKEAKKLDEDEGGSVGGGAMFKQAMNHHFLAKDHLKQAVAAEEQAQQFDQKAKDAEKNGNKKVADKHKKTAEAYRRDGHIHMDAMHKELIEHDKIAAEHDRIHGHGHAFPDAHKQYR